MANRNQFDRVQAQMPRAQARYDALVAGGKDRPRGLDRGYFVNPTVFANVSKDMTIAQEETFGAVLCIITYRNEDEAVAIANDSPFGLRAYMFWSDIAHAQAIARRLEVERVAINGMRHDALAPFGGYKQSSVGWEFRPFGLDFFLEAKTVMAAWLPHGDGREDRASPGDGDIGMDMSFLDKLPVLFPHTDARA